MVGGKHQALMTSVYSVFHTSSPSHICISSPGTSLKAADASALWYHTVLSVV